MLACCALRVETPIVPFYIAQWHERMWNELVPIGGESWVVASNVEEILSMFWWGLGREKYSRLLWMCMGFSIFLCLWTRIFKDHSLSRQLL